MKIQIKNGDLILVESNSVLVYENQKVSITFDDEYTLLFSFIEDSTIKEHQIDTVPLENGVEFILKNFNNPLGIALAKPLAFASNNGKDYYISFSSNSIGSSKVLMYNIYVDK